MGSSAATLAIHGGEPVRSRPIETSVAIADRTRQRTMELLETGRLSNYHNGPWAQEFEAAFAAYHGPDHHAIAVNSGTSALHLAVTAANIGPGDEVILPALCFVAAAIAVIQNGGVPIVCDAEPDTLTMDVELVEKLIGPRTKAIMVVHFFGYPANVEVLRVLCDRHGLALIEDCAQATGAPAHGRTVGTFGDYATYAFSVRKHISCGEGGLVMCRDKDTHTRLRELSNYGKGPGWDDYTSLGFSYRMAEFPSIVALDGLERLDDEIAARREAAGHYRELLDGSGFAVVPEPDWGRSVYFKCPILVPERLVGDRQKIVDAIGAENISCRIPHRPLYDIPWVAEYLKERQRFRGRSDCPVAAAAHRRLIEVETGPHLPFEEAKRSGAGVLKVSRHFSPAMAG